MTDPLPKLQTKLAKVQATPDANRFLGPWSLREVTWLIGEVDQLRGMVEREQLAFDDQLRDIRAATGEVERLRAEVAEWKQAAGAEADLADERGRTIARLRRLLGRLEWAGGIGYEGEPCCPVCKQLEDFRQHGPDCWLAAELANRPASPDPPEDEQP
jgi:hypothetical protein